MENYKFGVEGTLYFMVEEDRFTRDSSNYVKIGIVTGERDVAKREREHQTGNPRKIISHHKIQTQGVQMLETFLHNYFAENRVKGEWFRFNRSQLEEAVDIAEHRATEMGAYELNLEFVSMLNELEIDASLEFSLEDSEGLRADEITDQVADAFRELLVHRANKATLAKALLALRGTVDHPDEIFKITQRAETETLSTAQIRKLFPDLVAEFEEEKTSWAYRLPFLEGLTSEGAKAALVDIEEFGNDAVALHHAYLRNWSALAQSQWDFQMAEAQLLYFCGEAERLTLDGEVLVKWEQKIRTSISKQDFEKKYPEQAAKCYVKAPAREAAGIAEWQAY